MLDRVVAFKWRPEVGVVISTSSMTSQHKDNPIVDVTLRYMSHAQPTVKHIAVLNIVSIKANNEGNECIPCLDVLKVFSIKINLWYGLNHRMNVMLLWAESQRYRKLFAIVIAAGTTLVLLSWRDIHPVEVKENRIYLPVSFKVLGRWDTPLLNVGPHGHAHSTNQIELGHAPNQSQGVHKCQRTKITEAMSFQAHYRWQSTDFRSRLCEQIVTFASCLWYKNSKTFSVGLLTFVFIRSMKIRNLPDLNGLWVARRQADIAKRSANLKQNRSSVSDQSCSLWNIQKTVS